MQNIEVKLLNQTKITPKVDVIFVHGLLGDAIHTWRGKYRLFAKRAYWPIWLTEMDGVQVWTVNYPTAISSWQGNSLPIHLLANTISHSLRLRTIGQKPLVFIGHSMGGLLIKELLAQSRFTSDDESNLGDACVGLVLFGTPHHGAQLPQQLTQWAAFDGSNLNELRPDSKRLNASNNAFGYWLKHAPQRPQVLNYRETQKTWWQWIVHPSSADPGLGQGVSVIDWPQNHRGLCKINQRDDERYLCVQDLVQVGINAKLTINQALPATVLISYAWEDQAASTASAQLASDLSAAGLPVVSDHAFRLEATTPQDGWSAWREEVLAQATYILVVGGPAYLRNMTNNGNVTKDGTPYQGIILKDTEIYLKGLRACVPLMAEQQNAQQGLPNVLLRERYNGMVLPAGTHTLIKNLRSMTS